MRLLDQPWPLDLLQADVPSVHPLWATPLPSAPPCVTMMVGQRVAAVAMDASTHRCWANPEHGQDGDASSRP